MCEGKAGESRMGAHIERNKKKSPNPAAAVTAETLPHTPVCKNKICSTSTPLQFQFRFQLPTPTNHFTLRQYIYIRIQILHHPSFIIINIICHQSPLPPLNSHISHTHLSLFLSLIYYFIFF